jgi:ech hydrogenase subunit A
LDKVESLVAAAIWLPVIAAVLCYFGRSYTFRNIIVWITGISLAAVSLMLLAAGPFDYQPSGMAGLSWSLLVEVADFVLMAFILYIGIKQRHKLITGLTLIQLAILVYFDFFMGGHAAVNPIFAIDKLSIIMSLIINIIGSLITIYAVHYIAEHEKSIRIEKTRQPRFMFWLVIFLGAMNGLVFSNDLVWLYFFWEVTTLCSFELISHNLTEEAVNNACRALWMNMAGGVAFALALVFLAARLPGQPLTLRTLLEMPGGVTGTVLLALGLLVFAGLTKSAQMPFQSWLLGAMVAPTPVSALLHSSTMVKAGVYLIVRTAPVYQGTFMSDLVAVAGAFTFMSASVLAVTQSNAKRVLAYSTIANLGLIIACAGINTPIAISAAVALIIFHAVSKGLLFLCTGVIEHNIGSRDIEDMGGLVDRMPVTTVIVAIGVLSMFLPPFGMLVGKWASIEASAQLPLVTLMLVVASAVTALFWIKWLGRLLEGEPGLVHKKPEHLAPHYIISLGGLALGAVVLGILAGPVINNLVAPAVAAAYQTTGLIAKGSTLIAQGASGTIGMFSPWPLFAILAAAALGFWLWLKPGQATVKPVYLCGENSGTLESTQYLTTADQAAESSLANYYFTAHLDEAGLNKAGDVIAIAVIIMLLGVTIL